MKLALAAVVWTLSYLLIGWGLSTLAAYYDREADKEKGFYGAIVILWPVLLLVLPAIGLVSLIEKAHVAPWRLGMRLAKERNKRLDARDVLKKGNPNVPAGR